jgi:hypothetical protein
LGVLTAQLTFTFQPVIEKVRTRYNYFKLLHSLVLETFGFIVRVYLL